MMKRILALVEGQTEERFVKRVLAPHLLVRGTHVVPKIVVTKVTKSGYQFKGGIQSYAQVRKDLIRLLGDSDVDLVTTMLDYYGLPDDFPGRGTTGFVTAASKVRHLESAFNADINNFRFQGYLAMHEFEALLFSLPEEFDRYFPAVGASQKVRNIRNAYPSPEDINDGGQTHPAKRLQTLFPTYDKGTVGPVMAERIGLQRMRAECAHFAEWLLHLEAV